MVKACRVYMLMLCLVIPFAAVAAQSPENDINAKIRKEGMKNSRILDTLHFLTDQYGPRLTGSPSLKAAGEWAIKQMHSWGLENGRLEPWDFGHPGWSNERLTAHMVSPTRDHLTCEVLAWTPGTKGAVTADAIHMIHPDRPTADELTKYLASMASKVKGKIVLVGKHTTVKVTISPTPRRLDDKQARSRFDPNNPNAGQFPRPGGPRRQEEGQQQGPPRLNARQINEQIDKFLVENGAAIRINDGGRDHGQIRAFSNRTYDPAKVVPTVIMRNEDYGRITRILARGMRVELEFNITNRLYPEGKTAYNTIAEIPGTDKKDEVIMLGGHLDSWHAATGATDNAIGCAVMMEAARILKAIGVRPRRTIRVALWSGEEQGLLGSQAYVKHHFGTFEEPKPDYFKFGGYFNIDSGTGRARGFSVFGPPEAATVLRAVVAPFEDIGVVGAIDSKSRRLGGSDHTSFNQAGLPGIGTAQDPIEYGTYTWHTNLDTFERIIEEDAKNSAIVIAAAVYNLAVRDELLPRFSKQQMPPVPQQPGSTPARPQ